MHTMATNLLAFRPIGGRERLCPYKGIEKLLPWQGTKLVKDMATMPTMNTK